MPLTLDDGQGNIITLNDSIEWVDEYSWSSIKQNIQPTIGGGLVVSESEVIAGRPITLVSGDQVWVTKATFDSLMVLVNTIDTSYTLTLPDARTFTVKFDRTNGAPVVGVPIFRQIQHDASSFFTITLKLMEI